jgi:hypothetical protein
MKKINKWLRFGIPAVVLLLALVYYVFIPEFKIEESSTSVQRVYYWGLGATGFIDTDPTSAFMKETHRATRVRLTDEETPYTFQYEKEHLDIIERDSRRCEACHGSMRGMRNGKPEYRIHRAMLTAKLLNFHCTDCHKTVDLQERSPDSPTFHVDRSQCTRCHESDQGDEPVALKLVKPGNTDAVVSKYLISNHGTDTKGGERWIKRHGALATDGGIKECRRCHMLDSELDLCDECHGDEVMEL